MTISFEIQMSGQYEEESGKATAKKMYFRYKAFVFLWIYLLLYILLRISNYIVPSYIFEHFCPKKVLEI